MPSSQRCRRNGEPPLGRVSAIQPSNVAVGTPRYVDVVTGNGYATGTATYNTQAPVSGTGYVTVTATILGASPSIITNAFDTRTDVGDIFVPSDLGSSLKLALDANDPASSAVTGGVRLEVRHSTMPQRS